MDFLDSTTSGPQNKYSSGYFSQASSYSSSTSAAASTKGVGVQKAKNCAHFTSKPLEHVKTNLNWNQRKEVLSFDMNDSLDDDHNTVSSITDNTVIVQKHTNSNTGNNFNSNKQAINGQDPHNGQGGAPGGAGARLNQPQLGLPTCNAIVPDSTACINSYQNMNHMPMGPIGNKGVYHKFTQIQLDAHSCQSPKNPSILAGRYSMINPEKLFQGECKYASKSTSCLPMCPHQINPPRPFVKPGSGCPHENKSNPLQPATCATAQCNAVQCVAHTSKIPLPVYANTSKYLFPHQVPTAGTGQVGPRPHQPHENYICNAQKSNLPESTTTRGQLRYCPVNTCNYNNQNLKCSGGSMQPACTNMHATTQTCKFQVYTQNERAAHNYLNNGPSCGYSGNYNNAALTRQGAAAGSKPIPTAGIASCGNGSMCSNSSSCTSNANCNKPLPNYLKRLQQSAPASGNQSNICCNNHTKLTNFEPSCAFQSGQIDIPSYYDTGHGDITSYLATMNPLVADFTDNFSKPSVRAQNMAYFTCRIKGEVPMELRAHIYKERDNQKSPVCLTCTKWRTDPSSCITLNLLLDTIEKEYGDSNKQHFCERIVPDFVESHIAYAVATECTYQNVISKEYWKNTSNITKSQTRWLSNFEKNREKAILYGIYLQNRLDHYTETFHISVCLFDKYYQALLRGGFEDSSLKSRFNEPQMHIVISTCMLLAAKYDEIHPAPIDDFIYLFRQIECREFKKEKISHMQIKSIERHILEKIKWDFSRPTSYTGLRLYAIVLNYGQFVHHISKLMMDLIVVNSKTSHFSPSIASVVAITIAQKIVSNPQFDSGKWYSQKVDFTNCNRLCPPQVGFANIHHIGTDSKNWLEVLTMFSGYNLEVLQPAILEVCKFFKKLLISGKCTGKYKYIYDKFTFIKEMKIKFMEVVNEILTKGACEFSVSDGQKSMKD